MGEPPVRLAQFQGGVECRREASGPLGLTLAGRTTGRPGEELQIAFAAAAPGDLPARLENALIERTGTDEYRIAAGAREWRLTAGALHVQRNVAAAFYGAIPGRPAPLTRRFLYRVVLALARSRAGLALLRALRRQARYGLGELSRSSSAARRAGRRAPSSAP